jgi:hypothetical protein
MSAGIQAIMAARVEQGDRLLSETLCVAVTPEVRRAIMQYARAHSLRVADLITEAFVAWRRLRGEPELPEAVARPRPVRHRPPGRRAAGASVILEMY